MNVPGIVVAGTNSGVGKTTISIAIMHGLLERGYKVQPYKIGPDYIDPSYHNMISKRKSRNLDVWLMGEHGLRESYIKNNADADFVILEGVMGLYDGLSGKNNFASTAHISNILKLPIILIVDARKVARSLAAVVLGFIKFEPKIRIAGIIINNLSSERHLRYIKEAIESKIKLPILGAIFSNPEITYGERHLGLVPGIELSKNNRLKIMRNVHDISEGLDFETIIDISRQNLKTLQSKMRINIVSKRDENKQSQVNPTNEPVKILVALDKSFNFYYQDNLDTLTSQANIQFFSPIEDTEIPTDCSGIILGGGFPEVIADKLEENTPIRKRIFKLAESGIPIFAECGGLMYLTNSISGFGNTRKKFKMVGLFDAETKMTGKLTLGYTEAAILHNHPFLKGVKNIKGHEFHYSTIIINNNDTKMLYRLNRGKGISDGMDGLAVNNCVASYMHTHFIGSKISKNFVETCLKYSKS